MGYNYKNIDNRRQEAPFLILEKNIYQNLNVGTIAKVVDIYTGGIKLKSIPLGVDFDSKYSVSTDTYTKGDLVLVVFLDRNGTGDLNSITENIMHDYRNAVIIGKVHSL